MRKHSNERHEVITESNASTGSDGSAKRSVGTAEDMRGTEKCPAPSQTNDCPMTRRETVTSSAASDDCSASEDDDTPKCAACGKGGDGLKTCNACKLVKYCNATCQKAHRPTHKNACKKRAAELLDEALFKDPPPRDDCPICFLRLPAQVRTVYQLCCGKTLCDGCVNACAQNNDICPFCRDPSVYSNKETVRRCKKRMEAGDAAAYNMLGCDYDDGVMGLPESPVKAFGLFLRAGELGSPEGHSNVACSYMEGRGVGRDMKEAVKYFQLAAMGGHETSQYNLGGLEQNAGNMTRAMRHYVIAARFGHDDSLKAVKNGFRKGHVSKDEFEKTLRAYQEYQDEVKSAQRDKAVAVRAVDNAFASLDGR